MQFLPVIILLQLLLASLLVTFPSIKNHSIKYSNVLGITKLAQKDTGNAPGDNTSTNNSDSNSGDSGTNNTSTDNSGTNTNNSSASDQNNSPQTNQSSPSDNTSTAKTEQKLPTNTEESPSPANNSSTDQNTQNQIVISPNPEGSANPGGEQNLSSPQETSLPQPSKEELTSPNPEGSANPGGEQNLSSPQETSLPQPSKEELTSPNPGENATKPTSQPDIIPLSTSTALDPTEAISNFSNIDPNVINQVQEQNKQAQQAITPEAQVQTSVNSGNKDVSVINSALTKDNFTNVNLITQDLSQRIDRSLTALNQASPQQSSRLKQEFASFCVGADDSLRSAEEMVPEELEQDIEINRAKCLNTNNQQ